MLRRAYCAAVKLLFVYEYIVLKTIIVCSTHPHSFYPITPICSRHSPDAKGCPGHTRMPWQARVHHFLLRTMLVWQVISEAERCIPRASECSGTQINAASCWGSGTSAYLAKPH